MTKKWETVLGDVIAVSILIAVGLAIGLNFSAFIAITAAYMWYLGFGKFALLANWGQQVQIRRRTGRWSIKPLELFAQFIVWGLIGLLITAAFLEYGKFAAWAIPQTKFTMLLNGWIRRVLIAIVGTTTINITFAYPMMLLHEYLDQVVLTLIRGKRLLGPVEFWKKLDTGMWKGPRAFIPKTIARFWLPAHFFTFCFRPELRILIAALLSIALGWLKTIGKKK